MKEIIVYFLKLGCLGFGGPLALIAMMQKELVQQRNWMTDDEFRQAFGLIKAMPGPVAFQTSVFLGHHRKGFWGGLAAGICVVLPAFVLMVILAAFYTQFVEIPWVHQLMKGMQLGAFALIIWALKSLAQGFMQKVLFWVFLLSGVFLIWKTGIPEPLLILLFGITAIALGRVSPNTTRSFDPVLISMTAVCLKAGAFVFGTGLAIVPFLEQDFVNRLGWLTHEQFMDALSFGNLTPGPVVITVTFIGYKMRGLTGAFVATTAIFLPAFVHMVTWFPRMIRWLQRQTWIRSFTLGVTAAVCSAIILALVHIADGWNTTQMGLVVLLLVILNFVKIPSWSVILIGGALGFIL